MTKRENWITSTLAASNFALAGAVIFFALQLGGAVRVLPTVAQSLETVGEDSKPLNETLQAYLPAINQALDEVEAVRTALPAILDEVAAVRQATQALVPDVMMEIERVRSELPGMLTAVEKVTASADGISQQVAQIQLLVPDVLAESAAIRAALPDAMVQAEQLIIQAERATDRAAEGAVGSIVVGAVKTPFRLIPGVVRDEDARRATGTDRLMPEDLELFVASMTELLALDEPASRTWQNEETGVRGMLTVTSHYTRNGRSCRRVRNQAWREGERLADTVFRLCRGPDGKWERV